MIHLFWISLIICEDTTLVVEMRYRANWERVGCYTVDTIPGIAVLEWN